MHRSALIGLALLIATSMAPANGAAEATTPIRTPAEIAAAARIDADISAMSQAVASCAAASSSPAGCACRYPFQLQALRSSYAAALERFPAWRGRTLTWQDPTSHDTVVLALDGLERQLEAHCP